MINNISATYKGLITALIMIISSLFLFYFFHLPANGYNQFVPLGIFVTGIVWSLFSLKIRSNVSSFLKHILAKGLKHL